MLSSGGTPEALTTADPDKGEVWLGFPEILPGRKEILFTIGTGPGPTDTRIAVLRPDEGSQKIVVEGGIGARFVPTGHLLYGQSRRLVAIPFDLTHLEASGSAVPIVENVVATEDGPAVFTFSSAGRGQEAVKRLWPALGSEQEQRIGQSFQFVREWRVDLEITELRISGESAWVSCQRKDHRTERPSYNACGLHV